MVRVLLIAVIFLAATSGSWAQDSCERHYRAVLDLASLCEPDAEQNTQKCTRDLPAAYAAVGKCEEQGARARRGYSQSSCLVEKQFVAKQIIRCDTVAILASSYCTKYYLDAYSDYGRCQANKSVDFLNAERLEQNRRIAEDQKVDFEQRKLREASEIARLKREYAPGLVF